MFFQKTLIFTLFGVVSLATCGSPKVKNGSDKNLDYATLKAGDFGKYWFSGKAEVNSYTLTIDRYGESRKGDAVLVFVSEDMLADKQVKPDNSEAVAEKNKIAVLKLNRLQKFKTGIYDYAMMQSVFTPLDLKQHSHTLKLDASVQDWCGQVYSQLNLRSSGYKTQSFSYFEKEGDDSDNLTVGLTEDELFNRLRISPETLPLGEMEVIPSLFYLRLAHKPLKAMKANIKIEQEKVGDKAKVCIVEYPDLARELRIVYETEAPHKILLWKELKDGKETLVATLKKTMITDYWAKNSHQFDSYRDSLGLK